MTVAAPISKQVRLSNAITALRGALPDLMGVLVITDGLPVRSLSTPAPTATGWLRWSSAWATASTRRSAPAS